MEPLRITWRVDEMAESPNPLHLDGLTAHAQVRAMQHDGRARPGESQRALSDRAELPFEREERQGEWCWKASALIADRGWMGSGMRAYSRSPDPYAVAGAVADGFVDLPDKAYITEKRGGVQVRVGMKPGNDAGIDPSRGYTKQVYNYLPTRLPAQLSAWCIGDREELENLLDPAIGWITHLGSHARAALGRITSFAIERDERARERWQWRASPWPYEEATQMRIAVRYPYWAAENMRDGWIDLSLFG